ncbi:hypothetical protein [Acinetobacter phage vB_AbaM_CP14]|nr:hypothetical protein [Acinetobacter phage vB_AbaM_CP14]
MAMQRISKKKELNEQEIEMKEFFRLGRFEMTATYIAEVKMNTEDRYPMDKFAIVFKNGYGDVEAFDFYQGIGHRNLNAKGLIGKPYKTIFAPSEADVLYCLVLDASLANLSYEDYCNEFGCDSDNLKHKKLHMLMKENTKKLEKIFKINLVKIEQILQDY